MNTTHALTQLPQSSLFRKGDVFVLFGELFGRGYASGLVDQARKAGMDIVGITVGRRDDNNALRPLNAEELAAAEANLGGRIINVPLMAGFDLDAPAGERPFRVHVDPADDGAEVVNAVGDRVRTEFYRRIGLDDLLRPQVLA